MTQTMELKRQPQPAAQPVTPHTQDVKAYMRELHKQPGFREGVTNGPAGSIKTLEVSSWLQVPYILKALESKGSDGIRLVFPEQKGASPGSPSVVPGAEIYDFINRFHSKSIAEMHAELAQKIDASKELENPKNLTGVTSGDQWIAAFQLDQGKLKDSIQVSPVIRVEPTATKEELSLLLQSNASAQKQVILEAGRSQGEVSALFERVKDLPLNSGVKIWIGATTHYPGDLNPNLGSQCKEFDLKAFSEMERSKAADLEKLRQYVKNRKLDTLCALDEVDAIDLLAKDRTGKTVLENLVRIHDAKKLTAVSSKDPSVPLTADQEQELRDGLIASAIERLYHPGHAQQGQHGTCGAESILRLVSIRNPGEWSRLAADLIVDGKSDIGGGITVKPAEDWIFADKSKSREAFDALLQSSLMRFTAESQGFKYQNVNDKFEKNGVLTDGGMDSACAEKLISALCEPSKKVNRSELGGNPAEHLGQMAAKVGGIYVVLKWPENPGDNGSHAVILQGYDRSTKQVIFSNPHGEDKSQKSGDRLTGGIERTIVNNLLGEQAMSADLFNKNLLGAILPA